MTSSAQNISAEAQRFNWLLSRFATDTPGVLDAIAVSSDGLLIAASATLARPTPTGSPRSSQRSRALP